MEHPKIKTRLIDEMFSSVMGEYVFLKKYLKSYIFWRVEINISGLHLHSNLMIIHFLLTVIVNKSESPPLSTHSHRFGWVWGVKVYH